MARTKYGYPGIYNASPITLADQEGGALALDVNGNLKVAISVESLVLEVGGQYNLTPPTLTDGTQSELQLDSQGDLKVYLASALYGEDSTNNVLATVNKPVIAGTYSPSVSTNYLPSAISAVSAKAAAGNILASQVSNANAAVRFFQIHNLASAPVNPNVPLMSFPIPAGTGAAPGMLILDDTFYTSNGLYLSTGVAWGISTTSATYTAATASDHFGNLMYV